VTEKRCDILADMGLIEFNENGIGRNSYSITEKGKKILAK
jgi:predicted transcriptional regulator